MLKIIYQNKLLYPEIIWQRPVNFYKAKAGKLLIIAGSRGLAKKGLITADAAFRSGTGVITLAYPKELKNVYSSILPEAMSLDLPETPSGSLSRKSLQQIKEHMLSVDLVILGPGISTNTETIQLVWDFIRINTKPVVIDDDCISAIVYGLELIRRKGGKDEIQDYFNNLSGKLILTITASEAYKLIRAIGLDSKKYNSRYIENHKSIIAEKIQQILSATVVIKGKGTVLTDGTRIIEDKIGETLLDSTGAQEILSGIIGSFVAQNQNKIIESCATAIYLNSMALKQINAPDTNVIDSSKILEILPSTISAAENH